MAKVDDTQADSMYNMEDILMASLKAGNSIFKHIPDNIGEILYCDSSNPKAEPDTKEQTRIKVILSIIIPLVIISFCWLIYKDSLIFDTIVTIVLGLISLYCIDKCLSFNGVDYFVGSEGATKMTFNKTRDIITSKTELFFRDFEDLVVSETKIYKNTLYQGTDYSFIVYSHEIDGERSIVTSEEGTYKQEDPDGYYSDRRFRFWKNIETYWSQYKLALLKEALTNGEPIGFNVYTDKEFYNDYIVFQGNELAVHGKVYNKDNIKDLYIEKGYLIIEDVNHSTKMFGLLGEGDKEAIPISIIGNRELFILFFHYFASMILEYKGNYDKQQ